MYFVYLFTLKFLFFRLMHHIEDPLAIKDLLDPQELRDLKDHPDPQDLLVLKVPKVLLEFQDVMEGPDNLEHLVLLDKMENLAKMVKMERMDSTEDKDHLVNSPHIFLLIIIISFVMYICS